jgi:hypothetical protein
MAWTAPRTWVTGEIVTASLLNEQIRDNMLFMPAGPSVSVRRASNQSIASSAAFVAVTFDTEEEDTHAMWAPANPTRIVCPSGFNGLYLAIFHAGISVNATGQRGLRLQATGFTQQPEIVTAAHATLDWYMILAALLRMSAGNYFEPSCLQNSGVALNILGNSKPVPQIKCVLLHT